MGTIHCFSVKTPPNVTSGVKLPCVAGPPSVTVTKVQRPTSTCGAARRLPTFRITLGIDTVAVLVLDPSVAVIVTVASVPLRVAAKLAAPDVAPGGMLICRLRIATELVVPVQRHQRAVRASRR